MLTLCPNPRLVPEGMLRASQMADCLRVPLEQVENWCRDGVLLAEEDGGTYWVRVDRFRSFIERCSWAIVADPTGKPVVTI